MISGFHIGTELRRFKRAKLARVAIVAVILMPLLYSALYLWAFWNPFGNVSKLPIALVNSDKGITVQGKELEAGDQIVKALHENKELTWTETSAEDASKGVKDGEYYFALEIPENFSQAVASPTTDDPQKAQLRVTYNDANGYLSTLIGQNAMRELLQVVSDELGAQVVDQILLGVVDAGTGLRMAAEGAGKLENGANSLESGLVKLTDGANTLNTKLGDAEDGSKQLAAGANELSDGTSKLANGAGQLAGGTAELNAAVDEATGKLSALTGGVGELAGGIDQAGKGASAINDGVQALQAKADEVTELQTLNSETAREIARQLRLIPGRQTNLLADQLDQLAVAIDTNALGKDSIYTAQIRELSDGTAQLAYQLSDPNAPLRGGVEELRSGTQQLPGKLGELQNGVKQLNDGAQALNQGALALNQGATQLSAGANELSSGITQLHAGAGELATNMVTAEDGAKQLADGSSELHDKLAEGARQVPQWNEQQRLDTATVVGGPVMLTSGNDAGENTFGAGLAPFFFSLALFIGGIIVFLLLRPMQARAVASGVAPLRAALDGLWPAALIVTLQATAVFLVTIFGVGLNPVYPVALWLFSILVAVVFAALNQMFNVLLGPGPGKVAAMAFLMLQIIASGGLYPVQTEPKIVEFFAPVNPMTYTVNGFRQLIYGSLDERLPIAIVVLLLVLAGCLTATALGARRDRTWTMKRLHPAINI
ncbi:YhgE/Pip domain-containing protein [Corynebacterium pelargi]|uniref:Chromosome partition protein Smc n=1 Tax=Corynebacterium pelargi TaxID=1471400 RepID=A0A410W660_9CORY|nr:YhgE/Pip domain-containing protein [Corynebacterium pelargi]QAU51518.1 Chromosome partition protein Smc [Corynebacterium pelargi]GGG79727.1 membrane protein [Corynebacterium pelargi]